MDESEILNKILNEPVELSGEKRRAITSDSRYLRIVAGAGAGKTETLTRRIAYLLLIEKVPPSSIVAFTFTEKAAQSMKSRVYQKLTELGMEDFVKHLSEMYIGTIHSYCLRVLQEMYGFGNYKVFDENQEMAFLMRMGFAMGIDKTRYAQNCNLFRDTLGIFYDELLDRSVIAKEAPDFHDLLTKYEHQLDHHHRMTFGRIIFEAVSRIGKEPGKVGNITHLLVDEFQDINLAQFRLIQLIGRNASVFVVGDPRQSIYQWRGSNERFFNQFEELFGGAEKIEIQENWRSTERIVRTSNLFADCFVGERFRPLNSGRKENGDISRIIFEDAEQEARWVADQVQKLVEEGKCQYWDFALLFRSVGTSAEPFIAELKGRSIPYIVGGKLGLFKRDEAQAIGRLICWLSEDGFWVANPYKWGEQEKGDRMLDSALSHWALARDQEEPIGLRDRLLKWKASTIEGRYRDLKSSYHGLLIALDYRSLDLNNPLDLALMANLGRFSSLLGDFESSQRLGGNGRRWLSELRALCWFINTYASSSYGENHAEDLRYINAVNVTTVHQSKGLEWPVVFVPSLVKGRFPSSQAGKAREWMIPRTLFDHQRYQGGIEDEKRVFYVAITRAMDVMVLSHFRKYKNADSRSEFLKVIDPVITEERPYFRLDYHSPKRKESEEIQTYSATEIIGYTKCPHHYRLSNLWGYAQTLDPLIGYGEAVHHCLRHSVDSIRKGSHPVESVQASVDREFFLPFADGMISEVSKNKARKMLAEFARKNEEDMRSIEEVETRVEFPTSNATIIGKVDVILRKDNILEIRDYKTSSKVISDEDSDMQLRLYTIGLRGLGKQIGRGSIAYLEDCTLRSVSLDEDQMKLAKVRADEIIGKIQGGSYDPRPSQFCKICEYDDICRCAAR